MIVIFTINLGWVIVTESALGFLGLGMPPDVATWGVCSAGRGADT